MTSLGLLYTILAQGADEIMIPNAVVMNVAIVPLREPAGVDVRARLRVGVTPAQVEDVLRETLRTPLRGGPRVQLEEIDADEVVVRIAHAAAARRRPASGERGASGPPANVAPETAGADHRQAASSDLDVAGPHLRSCVLA
ncbi:MAG: hypothetical protein ACR2H2_03120 [Solirubrobacteraceae bacterium]